MAERLFPVFDLPAAPKTAAAEERKYRPSLAFDFEKGDFVRSGAGNLVLTDGRGAYAQWCRKMVSTERLGCLSYGQDQGTEFIDAMAQPEAQAARSAIERTVTEALKVNPATEYVRDFTYRQTEEGLLCSFTVKGYGWEEFPISAVVKNQ